VTTAVPGAATRPRPHVRLPGWLGGGDIDGFAQEAGLKLKPIDKGAGIWEVRTLEDYHKTPPRLVTTRRLATPATIDRTDALASLGALRTVSPGRRWRSAHNDAPLRLEAAAP